MFLIKVEKNVVFRLYRVNEDVYASPNVWKIYTVSYMHYSTIGTVVGIGIGLLVSLLFPVDQDIDPRLLTPCIRKLACPGYAAKRNPNGPGKTDDGPVKPATLDTKL